MNHRAYVLNTALLVVILAVAEAGEFAGAKWHD